ncbi:MBL fold metallo-hydrolase, partial [Salmonella enterica]|nr:MBL fold metallo-hydrolase [Salmonella enterica]
MFITWSKFEVNTDLFYHEFSGGKGSVTSINDGDFILESDMLNGDKSVFFSGKSVSTSINAFLVKINQELILVDVGAGRACGQNAGKTLQNLNALGVNAADINKILLTHLHTDHVMGLVDSSGKAIFGNAILYVPEKELRVHLDTDGLTEETNAIRSYYKNTLDLLNFALSPYIAKNVVRSIPASELNINGLTSIPTPGHTPGHTSYLFEFGEEKLLVWGDIVHASSLQFQFPEITVQFDADAQLAQEARVKIFEKAASEKWMVAGAHLPFPGIGYLQYHEQNFSWRP